MKLIESLDRQISDQIHKIVDGAKLGDYHYLIRDMYWVANDIHDSLYRAINENN